MLLTENYYWHGIAANVYLISCWLFAVIRWFHTCRAPKDRHEYIWPDRKMQVTFFCCSVVLLPYILNPLSEDAWLLWKSYFPCTYYYYCGSLLFCFFGSVKQWSRWKTTNWVMAIITLIAMMPLIMNAWIPEGFITEKGLRISIMAVQIVSLLMVGYCGLAMWQVWQWIKEARDEAYSNPDDFPIDYARRVWLMPLYFTPLLWPAYLLDNPDLMAILNILLAVANVVLLLNVLPIWRRNAILSDTAEPEPEEYDEHAEERMQKIANEIETFVDKERGFLDPHLKIGTVVSHCSYSRTYVSQVFTNYFGGFSNYVNRLRLNYYEYYMEQHPNSTKDTAAQESGFTSYTAYYKVKERLSKGK